MTSLTVHEAADVTLSASEGGSGFTADQLRAHARHVEHVAMSSQWIAENRLFISPTSLKFSMAFPGEGAFSSLDPAGEPLTMHRHLQNSRRRARWTPSFLWPVEGQGESVLSEDVSIADAGTISFSPVIAKSTSHLPQHTAITLEQAMRGDFSPTRSSWSIVPADQEQDPLPVSPGFRGSHQFLPPYMLQKIQRQKTTPRGKTAPAPLHIVGHHEARQYTSRPHTTRPSGPEASPRGAAHAVAPGGPHAPAARDATSRPSPRVTRGGIGPQSGQGAGSIHPGGWGGTSSGASSWKQSPYPPMGSGTAREGGRGAIKGETLAKRATMTGVESTTGRESARGRLVVAQPREEVRALAQDGLNQYLLPPGKYNVWRPKTTPGEMEKQVSKSLTPRVQSPPKVLTSPFGTRQIVPRQAVAGIRQQLLPHVNEGALPGGAAGGPMGYGPAFERARQRSAQAFASLVSELDAVETKPRGRRL